MVVAGTISSAAFRSGDRFVVGHWPRSPLGHMCDVMWTDPGGRRTLLSPSRDIADFITAIYEFDRVCVGSLDVRSDGRTTTVSGAQLCGSSIELRMTGGRRRPLPFRRPLAVTRFVEAPIARALMGVEVFGTSPTGAREWYQSSGWRWVTDATAAIDDRDLGSLVEFGAPVGVGFSEPPRRPSVVSVRVSIDLPG
ncbi:MAG: hypothetical protein ACR2QK_04575 [Acidimicrobiales bacterium]